MVVIRRRHSTLTQHLQLGAPEIQERLSFQIFICARLHVVFRNSFHATTHLVSSLSHIDCKCPKPNQASICCLSLTSVRYDFSTCTHLTAFFLRCLITRSALFPSSYAFPALSAFSNLPSMLYK